ncbi:MAG TPA: M20/M25/M40 family metallo-hydrolase, partial [Thermoanaerobaculia bacterium]|nr:M20/M25/M40 family metallo-hydrolase [Thermoanaerobaculia bacterium]
ASTSQGHKRDIRWPLPGALALLLLTLGLSVLRLAPPAPRPSGAPSGDFSAARARALLTDLASGDTPRPAGSAPAARTRERAAAELRRLGYAVREEEANACNEIGSCRSVRNLVAELPGREPGSAVALVSHYDSVAAGPGIADDLSGVAATLEVARALKAGPPLRHAVLFLIDDGEEEGLLGARAFVMQSLDAARVKAVVNLEARGTSGPSLMFETGRDNAEAVALFARAVPHPRASSLFPLAYDLLPSLTDFSIFKHRGVTGFNFAFIGDPARYHSPLDTLANLSSASLQHQGENALATVRALADTDLDRPRRGSSVFFDVLGLRVFAWPVAWGPLLAAVPLMLSVVTAVKLHRRSLVTVAGVARGLLAWWAVPVLAAVAGLALSFALRLAGLRALWPAHGVLVQAAFWLLASAVTLLVTHGLRRQEFLGLWTGGSLVWALLGLMTALLLPGASYLFMVPAWMAGTAGLFLPGGERTRAAVAILPALAAAVLWFPLLILFYDGLGSPVLWLLGTLLALVLTPIVPLAARQPYRA